MFSKSILGLSMASLLMASAAIAETQATAWTDLNLRAGPGPIYKILGVIPANQTVDVQGCLEGATWCKVSFADAEGWAYGDYLTATVDEAPMALTVAGPNVVIKTVTYTENPDDAVLAGGGAGIIAGALIGGPVGAVIGGIVGAGAGAAIPDTRYITYVQTNPVDTVYLDGEVVVGAGIPEPVTLYPIPDSVYSYIYVNGVPVLVETPTRKVVYIVR
jgi:uncharacterized protein YraI